MLDITRHEHIYERIQHHLLRSDELPPDIGGVERAIGGSPVMLCTLSMLSNPMLSECGIFHILPVERLVIDEASQIDIGEYMVRAILNQLLGHSTAIIASLSSV